MLRVVRRFGPSAAASVALRQAVRKARRCMRSSGSGRGGRSRRILPIFLFLRGAIGSTGRGDSPRPPEGRTVTAVLSTPPCNDLDASADTALLQRFVGAGD